MEEPEVHDIGGVLHNKTNGRWVPGTKPPNPAGRPVMLKTVLKRVERQTYNISRDTGASVLEILLAYARRDKEALDRLGIPLDEATFGIQRWALQAALPYAARRLPPAVFPEEGLTAVDHAAISLLPDDELDALVRIFRRVEAIREGLETSRDEDDAADREAE